VEGLIDGRDIGVDKALEVLGHMRTKATEMGLALSGVIAEAWGWRAAFFIACVPGLILAVAALRIREPVRGASEAVASTAQPATSGVAAAFGVILRVPTMWWIILSGILFNFHAYAVNMFQNAFL